MSQAPIPTPSSVPDSLHYGRRPIEVWQEADEPGAFHEVSDRFAVETIHQVADGRPDRARLRFVFDELDEPMVDASGSFQPDYLARAVNLIDPDKRLRVILSGADREVGVCVFEGYPVQSTLAWDWRADAQNQGIVFDGLGMLDRWRTDIETQVIGRWTHGNLPDTSPAPGQPEAPVVRSLDNLRLLESQPCVFNEGGEPNCSPFPITVTFAIDSLGSTLSLPVYVFAARQAETEGLGEAARAVQRWTYARAVAYLLYFYGVKPYVSSGVQRPIEPPSTFLINVTTGEPKLIDQTTPADRTPAADLLAITGMFARAVLAAPDAVACDRTSLLNALTVLTRSGDLHLAAEYRTQRNGSVDTRLNVFAVGSGGPYELRRREPRQAVPATDRAALDANKIMANTATFDYREVVNAPILVCGPTQYEITVELVPGWTPETYLDEVDTSSQSAVTAAREHWDPLRPNSLLSEPDPDVVKFLRSNQGHPPVHDVGRKWVLNETGAYRARDDAGQPLYMRSSGVFDEAAYNPFDFSASGITDRVLGAAGVVDRVLSNGDWARVPRSFRDPLTKSTDGATGPYVEVSYDSGATWHHETRVWISDVEAAVTFVSESPLEITPPKVDWWTQNMWHALIDGTFRVRVTATVIGDRLLIPRRGSAAQTAGSAIGRPMARIFDRPGYAYQLRTEAQSALSQLTIAAQHDERMDLQAAESRRRHLGRAFSDRLVSVKAGVPWLDTLPKIGAVVTDIAGIGLSLTMRSSPESVRPQIVGLTWTLRDPQSVELLIGDLRHGAGEVG